MTRGERNVFDRARVIGVALLVVAAGGAFAGAFMNWTTAGVLPPLPETTFEGPPPEPTDPISGVETREGNIVLAGATVVLLGATLLGAQRRRGGAWLAFLASIVMGSIAIAAYRGIDDIQSGFSQRIDAVGDIDPAAGLALVATAAVIGLVGGILGLVATPAAEEPR
ncbi:MAG TPA: hypothetical protein VM784_04740 [Actinomycetota bacterium]|nr:hypothetical protein [Actinomycetota bacterium]